MLQLLSHLLLRHGHASSGTVLLQALHAVEPGDAWTQQALASAYLRVAQPDQCLRLVQHLRDQGDVSEAGWLLEAKALQALGRRTEARRAYRQFLALRSPIPTEPNP